LDPKARSSEAQHAAQRATYDPSLYWQDLHRMGGLAAVANPWVPERLNYWFYRNWAARLEDFVERYALRPTTVFDVGAGTGYWVDWWRAHGARTVSGCDLSPLAAERLTARFGSEFIQLDIADGSIPGTFDLVSVMNVLLHVMDPAGFDRALRTVAAAVKPGGHLLLMEPLLSWPAPAWDRVPDGATSRARRMRDYLDPLTAAGLGVVNIEPATALGSDPIESGRRSYRYWARVWRVNCGISSRVPAMAPLIGRAIYHLDPLCLRLGAAPSEKFLLLRRPEPAT
jgi:SAM-dependent methyltransferase